LAKKEKLMIHIKDEQELFDDTNAKSKLKLASVCDFKNILADAEQQSYDPISNALKRHPGLTREIAEAMAKAFGF